jgi:hypothetical protein
LKTKQIKKRIKKKEKEKNEDQNWKPDKFILNFKGKNKKIN